MDGRCQIVQDLYQSGWIQTTPYVILLTQAISATIIIHFAFFGIKRIQMHRNSRFLLQNLNFSALLGSVGCTFLSIYRIINYTNYREHCNLLAPYQVCFLMRLPNSISFMIMNTTILAVFIERLCATLKSAKYERRMNRCAMVVLILLQWAIATVVTIFYWYDQVSEYLLPICRFEIQKSHYIHYVVIGIIFIDIFSIIVFFVLLFYNKKLKKDCTGGVPCSLTMRYQLRENIRILKLLLRLAYVSFSMLIAEFVIFIVLPSITSFTQFFEITLICETFHQPAIYAAIVVLLITCGNKQQKKWGIFLSKSQNAKEYINELQKFWGDESRSCGRFATPVQRIQSTTTNHDGTFLKHLMQQKQRQ